MRSGRLLLALLLLPLIVSAQTTLPHMGVGRTIATGPSGCLLIEATTDKILQEDLSGCIGLE